MQNCFVEEKEKKKSCFYRSAAAVAAKKVVASQVQIALLDHLDPYLGNLHHAIGFCSTGSFLHFVFISFQKKYNDLAERENGGKKRPAFFTTTK